MDRSPAQQGFRPHPGLLVSLGVMAVAGGVYYWNQNHRKAIGGGISVPKIFWLFYALPAWFIVPIFLMNDPRVDPALRRIYGWHLISWWGRGAAELYLMYAKQAWKPPYGIGHDVATMAMVTALIYGNREAIAQATDPASRNAHRYLWVINASLVAEIAFAYLFNKTVAGKTEEVWFADDDPRFDHINRLTAMVDVGAYAALAATVYGYYRKDEPWPSRLSTPASGTPSA